VPSDHEIVLMGDEHSGNLLSYEDGIKEVHDYILSAGNRFVVKMGDRIDAIASDDKRYDLTAKEPIPLQQAKQAIKDDLCVADRTLVRLQGNHEMKLWRFGDLAAFIAEQLKQPYGTYSCVLEVSDQFGPMYRIWLSHGFRTVNSNAKDWEQRIANMKASLKMKMKYKAGDCLVMAMGHCFSEDTEILTQEGWKTYNDIGDFEKVLTFNTETEKAEWQHIEAKYVYTGQYKEMLECETNMINFAVTEDHRIIRRTGHGNWTESKAIDAMNSATVTIPMSASSGNEELGIDDDMLRLVGWLISEGTFRPNGAVQLYQNWEGRGEIERVLNSLEIPFSLYRRKFKGREFKDGDKTYTTKDDCAVFYVKTKDAGPIRCFIDEKKLPSYVFKLSDRQFEILMRSMMAGDGHWQNENVGQYYSASHEIIDMLQAACMCHGWRTSKKVRYKRDRANISLNIVKTTTSSILRNNSNRSGDVWHRIPATKAVWCVSVQNGTVAIRRNGKPSFLGNTHKLLVVNPAQKLYLTYGQGKPKQHYLSCEHQLADFIDEDSRWYINTGSFLKQYGEDVSGYGEVNGYDPVEMGSPIIVVHDRKVTGAKRMVV
jgi:hypothetical protein